MTSTEERAQVVPGVGGEAVLTVAGAAVGAAAGPAELVGAALGGEDGVLEEVGDRLAAGKPGGKRLRAGNDAQRVDLAQIGDHDAAGRGDGRAHLSGRGARREPDDGEAERVPGAQGGARQRERA